MLLYSGDIIDVDGTFYAKRIGRCIVLNECGKRYAIKKAEQYTVYKIYSFELDHQLELTPEYNRITILARINDANVSCN